MRYWQTQIRDLLQTTNYDFNHFTTDSLLAWLEAEKGRKIRLVPWTVPTSISGAWLSTTTTDYIFYDERAPRIYREHIQLNHLGRLLLNQTTLMVHEGSAFHDNDLRQVAFRGVFDQLSKKVLIDMINYVLSLQQKEC